MFQANVDTATVYFTAQITTFLLEAPLPSLDVFYQDFVDINVSEVSRTYTSGCTILTCRNILDTITSFHAITHLRNPNARFSTLTIAFVLLQRLREYSGITGMEEFTPSIWLAAAVFIAHKFDEDFYEGPAFWADAWNIHDQSLLRAERALLTSILWDVWVKQDEVDATEEKLAALRGMWDDKERVVETGVEMGTKKKVKKFRRRGGDETSGDERTRQWIVRRDGQGMSGGRTASVAFLEYVEFTHYMPREFRTMLED
jgi:hypothetical protein